MQSAVSGGQGAAVTPDIASLLRSRPARRIARIHLFWPMRATSYLGDDILPRSKKGRALFAYLCLSPETRGARLRLARTLWDRTSDEHARGSLRHALLDVC